MTAPNETGDKEGLPLPAPRSPKQLDERILSYARTRAPERLGFSPPWWLTGMATASVIVIAVFITVPELSQTAFKDQNLVPRYTSGHTNAESPAELDSISMDAIAVSADDAESSEQREMATPAAKFEASPRPLAKAKPNQLKIISAQSIAEEKPALIRMQEASKVATPANRTSGQAAADTSIESVVVTAERNMVAALDPLGLPRQLQLWADALERGEEQEAREGYQQLRQRCPQCDLPETLEAAIKQHLEQSPR